MNNLAVSKNRELYDLCSTKSSYWQKKAIGTIVWRVPTWQLYLRRARYYSEITSRLAKEGI